MRTILCSIFEMSLTATLLILILVLFRPVLKKIPAWIRCGIWAMPAVRLLCPFSVKSSFSIIPDWKELNPFAVSYDTGRPFSDNIVTAYQFGDSTLNMAGSGTPQAAGNIDFMQLLFVIWLAGIAAMAGYMIFGTLYLKKRTSVSVEIKQHVFLCDEIDTPFVSGILRPKIYMPSGLDAETMENAEAHEQAHIKRFDYLWKLLAFAALALHWFNPAAWLGYILFCRDIELACDENVVKGLSQEEKVQYSQSILNCSARKRSSYLYTVGFSETAVRDRVKHIFDYRSPSFKAIAGMMIFYILFMGMLMTNPFMEEENSAAYRSNGGYLRTVENRDEDGNLVSVLKYSYDKNKVLDKMTVQDSEGNIISERNYILDNTGWISRAEEFDAKGNLVAVSQYTRDDSGNELTCKETYADGTFCWWNEYKYDSENNPVEYVRYQEDGSVYYTWKSLFDDSGNETERVCRDSNGNEMWSQTFGYDTENELVYTEQYSPDGKLASRTDYKTA